MILSERPWRIWCILITGAIFLLLPPYEILFHGPFRWHVVQPQTLQGGIEAAGLLLLLAASQWLTYSRHRLALTLVIAAVYLRRHDVDVAVILDLLYFEILFAAGALMYRVFGVRRADDTPGYLRMFALGLALWSVCAWSISALGFGSVSDLRWMTLLLGVLGMTAKQRPWLAHVHARVALAPPLARVVTGVLLGGLLVLFARTQVVTGFDSLWYGLRGQYVLVGAGSAFASMGLVSPVHYFPKLLELLLIPLSGLGDNSVITGVSLLLLALLGATCNQILVRLGVASLAVRLTAVGICLTIPALDNSGLEAKPDILAAWLTMLAMLSADDLVVRRDAGTFAWMLGLILLAVQAKLTALPYVGALSIMLLIAWVRTRDTRPSPMERSGRRLAIVFALLAASVSLLITTRTWLLTGMPTVGPEPLFHLWKMLGFELAFPAGTLPWMLPVSWSDTPRLAFDLAFRPQYLEHGITSWVGNVWLWFALIAMMGLGLQRTHTEHSSIRWLAAGLIAAGAYLQFGVGYSYRGGDGNYFISAFVPATLIGFAAAWHSLVRAHAAGKVFLSIAVTIGLAQAAYGFVTAGWAPGTRALDFDFSRSPQQSRKSDRALIQNQGLSIIAEQLESLLKPPRVVGHVADEVGMRLPASYESLIMISYSRPEVFADTNALLKFLIDDHIDFMILPVVIGTELPPPARIALDAMRQAAGDAEMHIFHDRDYDLYELAALRASVRKNSSGRLADEPRPE